VESWPPGGYFLDRVNGLATRMFNASRREPDDRQHLGRLRRATMSVLYVAFLSALVLEFFARSAWR